MAKDKALESTLGEALRLFRVFHDLSTSEMAKRLGVSAGYVSLVENGHKKPNLDLIEKYSQIFETTPSAILFFSEDLGSGKTPMGLKSKLRTVMLKFMRAVEDASP